MKKIIMLACIMLFPVLLRAEIAISEYLFISGYGLGGLKLYVDNAAYPNTVPPDHSMYFSRLDLNVIPVENLKVTYILEMEKPSTCAGYNSDINLRNRIRASYEGRLFASRDLPEFLNPQLKVQVFDFKNQKAGQGLTYDCFDGDGIEVSLKWYDTIKAGMWHMAAGYIGTSDDVETFFVDSWDGLVKFSYVRTFGSTLNNNIFSLSSRVKINDYFSLAGEAAAGFSKGTTYEDLYEPVSNNETSGVACFAGIDFNVKKEFLTFKSTVCYRYYSEGFNLPFYQRARLPVQAKDRYGISPDNWLNYIKYPFDINGFYAGLSFEARVIDENFRVYAELSQITFYGNRECFDTLDLYDYGFKYSVFDYLILFLSLTNKVLGDGTVPVPPLPYGATYYENYLLRETDMYVWLKAEIRF